MSVVDKIQLRRNGPFYDIRDNSKSPLDHTHDDRYYTESEITAFLAEKAPLIHTHDDRYYTESEIDAQSALISEGFDLVNAEFGNVYGLLQGKIDGDFQYITSLPTGREKSFAFSTSSDISVGGITIPIYSKGVYIGSSSSADAVAYAFDYNGRMYTLFRNGTTWGSARTYSEDLYRMGPSLSTVSTGGNFNGYTSYGMYAVTTDAIASSLVNCPSSEAGVLKVFNGNGAKDNADGSWRYIVQQYDTRTGKSWKRYGSSGSNSTIVWDTYGWRSLDFGMLRSQHIVIANGSTGYFYPVNSEKGVIFITGALTDASEILIYNSNASGGIAGPVIRNTSRVAIGLGTNTIAIENKSGYAMYAFNICYTSV